MQIETAGVSPWPFRVRGTGMRPEGLDPPRVTPQDPKSVSPSRALCRLVLRSARARSEWVTLWAHKIVTPSHRFGPDEIAYCVENSINPGTYFTKRGFFPSLYSESAAESGGWTGSRVHTNWTWNMYEKP